MQPHPVLYRWMRMIDIHFPHLTYWQVVALAVFSYGVVLARHCQLNRVAEELAFIGQADTMARRWRRFLGNPRLEPNACGRSWVRWVWSSYAGAVAVLLVDETKLGDRLAALMVSLAYRGRAIPLVWRCFRANCRAEYPAEGQVGVISSLLRLVQSALPPDTSLIVEADQGIGHSSALMRALAGMGVSYLVRVAPTSTFTTRCGVRHHLYDLIQPGQQWSGVGILFSKPGCQVECIVHLMWVWGYDRPWCLATNDPTLRASDYAVRYWQEESFRDLKRGGWQWNASFVSDPMHAARLILVLALAYAWMLTQGTLVLLQQAVPPPVKRRSSCLRFSVFRLGVRAVKWLLVVDPSRIHVGLFFVPLNPRLC